MGIAKLRFYKRDDISLLLVRQDGDGAAVDITGYTYFFTMKTLRDDTDADALIQKVVTAHTDPTNGKTTISIDAADTASIAPGAYFYDIQEKDTSGNIMTWTSDTFQLEQDITVTTS